MARLLLCLLLLVPVACSGGDDARLSARLADSRREIDALTADLEKARRRADEARARAEELERDLIHRSDVDRARFVDLWGGGPTMSGPFLALPRLGVMRWTCDDRGRFRVSVAAGGASVHASYDAAGRTASRMLHSARRLRATLAAGDTGTWTITHRHPPGFIRARVEVRTARSKRGSCLLPSFTVTTTAHLYE